MAQKRRTRRAGVACPHCDCRYSETVVTSPLEGQIARTRRCHGCERSFLTTEVADLNAARAAIYTGVDFLKPALLHQQKRK